LATKLKRPPIGILVDLSQRCKVRWVYGLSKHGGAAKQFRNWGHKVLLCEVITTKGNLLMILEFVYRFDEKKSTVQIGTLPLKICNSGFSFHALLQKPEEKHLQKIYVSLQGLKQARSV
jgi:hypothetical protein